MAYVKVNHLFQIHELQEHFSFPKLRPLVLLHNFIQ